jgi:hypothetical protein
MSTGVMPPKRQRSVASAGTTGVDDATSAAAMDVESAADVKGGELDRADGGRGGAVDEEKGPAAKRSKSTDDAAPPTGPAASERDCSRQLNWLWSTARVGLPSLY